MKRNLSKGIVLISIVLLSSCSVTSKLAGTQNNGDDVYYTKAIAGDQVGYADVTTNRQNSYSPDNDYYYYGDYTSRINRFSYSSPFDYDDDFYFSNSDYTPDTPSKPSENQATDQSYDYAYDPVQQSPYNFGVYSPFDFGYYGFGGYDDFDYGGGYVAYLSGGGRHHSGNQATRPANTGGGSNPPLTFRRANTGNNPSLGIVNSPGLRGNTANATIYPGRPGTSVTANSTTNTYNNSRPIRQASDNPRPQVIQTQSVQSAQPSSPSTSNTSSSSGGGSSGSGGGGRPVRP